MVLYPTCGWVVGYIDILTCYFYELMLPKLKIENLSHVSGILDDSCGETKN